MLGPRAAALAAGLGGSLVLSLAVGMPAAQALQTAQTSIVSANPADFTPNVLDGEVDTIVQMGSTIVLGGTFTTVQEVTPGAPVLVRNHVVAFDATTGVISQTFNPQIDGNVEALLPAGDGTSLYVGGDFNNVDGKPGKSLVRLNLADGSLTHGFAVPKPDGVVKDLRLVNGQLVLAGIFQHIGKTTRGQIASVDPTTGALTSFVSFVLTGPIHPGDIVKVSKMDVSPDGSKLLAIGNFTRVNGLARSQVFMLNTSGATATLSTWQTAFFPAGCFSGDDTYLRDVDISPDGTYAVISTTGGYHGPLSPCDTQSRWALTNAAPAQQPMWLNVTGGDTTQAVAITGTAVYVGGHFRWANNPLANNVAGPGAVPREGLAALDPTNGLPLSWNPGRARGVGVFAILATDTGLWVGSDTDQVGGETHGRIAFFPLDGGVPAPPNVTGYLPDDVYLMGTPGTAAGTTPVNWTDTIDRQFWIGPHSAPEATAQPALGGSWGSSRGSFLVDGTVYSGWSDGTFQASSFDGTTLGAPVSIPLFGSSFAADIPTMTGIVYASSRIYYTLAGNPNLYTRSFTPQSQVVGAQRFVVGGTVSALNPAQVTGMFLSGSKLYFADATTGHLLDVTLSGESITSAGTITGPAVLADSTIDWRSRGAFVWNGSPAPRPNTLPTALFTTSCNGTACTFNASTSFDPDGHLVSYAWDFGDGTTGTGVLPTHLYPAAGAYTVSLTVTDYQGGTATASAAVHPVHSQYSTITPCRVFDTRTGKGTCSGSTTVPKAPLGANKTLSVKMTAVAGVPANATAVVLNVTAVGASTATYITVWPHSGAFPLASNLNVSPGSAIPNLVVAPIGAGGAVDFYNAKGTTHLVADIAGYFSPTSPADYTAVGPCRLFDTRTGTGVCSGAQTIPAAPLVGGTPLPVQVAGVGSIPADATAVVLNVTGLQGTADTFVTVWPDGTNRPLTSNLNLVQGSARPNLVIVPIGSDGMVDFYNAQGTLNLVADVAGYFSPSSTAGYTPGGPCRLLDTRTGTGTCLHAPTITKAPLGPTGVLSIKVTDVAGIPENATAVVLNVTAVNATQPTFVTVWPDGGPPPLASNLNVAGTFATPNLVVVPIGADGSIDFYNDQGNVNLVADVAGYFSP